MGGDEGSATQIHDIPEWARPYAQGILTTAGSLVSQPYSPYQGMTIAPMNSAQEQGLGMIAGAATGSSPDTIAARQRYIDEMGGKYQNPWATQANSYAQTGNPELTAMINKSNEAITGNYMKGIAPGIDTAFARQGGYGGSLWEQKQADAQGALAKSLGENTSNLMFQDYAQKAGLQESAITRGLGAWQTDAARAMQAAQGGMGGQAMDINAGKTLLQTGDAMRGYTQDQINAAKADYDQMMNYPWLQLDRLGSALGKSLGGSSVTTQTGGGAPKANPLGGAFGGAMLGAGAGATGMFGDYSSYAPWLGAALGAGGSFM